jgi:hypothetical protein
VPKRTLSARQVQVAREGDTHDGEGLILRVQKSAASRVLRYRVASGKPRELGLGVADRSNIEAAGASLTGAPRAFKEKVVIGNSGGEYGVGGYISAYDTETGKLAWRFYTVPGDPSKPFENKAMQMAVKT